MICMMSYEIATPRQVGARNDIPPFVVARHVLSLSLRGMIVPKQSRGGNKNRGQYPG